LDAGGGQFSISWRKVQGEIARFTRVCSYDRAGYGFSDANTRPSTAVNIVEDLHKALETAGVRPPLILVGHSAGGLYATLYADLHPAEVVGLVLVDPGFASSNHDDAVVAWSAYPELLASQQAQRATYRKVETECAAKARAGLLRGNLGQCSCAEPPKDTPELAPYFMEYCSGPKPYEGALAEEAALIGKIGDLTSISDGQEAAAARPFGDMPLTVLTNGRGWSYTPNADLNARLTIVWRAGHVALAGRSDRGKVIVVSGSSHSIQEEKPAVVVSAVREMMPVTVGSGHPE
jgi:pimeloyl-ACP methyl ester carboxylesterase